MRQYGSETWPDMIIRKARQGKAWVTYTGERDVVAAS
jgi:hypothetical protein